MNTFTIYKGNSKLFDRICHNPPSLEDINPIHDILKRSMFSNIAYYIDIIHENNHQQLHGHFYSADEFINYFTNLCEEGIKYGVVMYLN